MSYLVITGAPRSGTKYIATCLRQAGIDVCHENHGTEGIVDWRYSCAARNGRPVFIHQVRRPLDTVSSMLALDRRSLHLIGAYMPEVTRWEDPVSEWAAAYLACSDRADKLGQLRYRVEQVETKWDELLGWFEREATFPSHVSTDLNSRDHPDLGWADIPDRSLRERLQNRTREYGYS